MWGPSAYRPSMHGWESVETVRCSGCGIYTPTSDLRLAPGGRPYCFACPAPAASPRREPRGDGMSFEEGWPRRSPIERSARVTAAVMLIVTLAFPLAACASQL